LTLSIDHSKNEDLLFEEKGGLEKMGTGYHLVHYTGVSGPDPYGTGTGTLTKDGEKTKKSRIWSRISNWMVSRFRIRDQKFFIFHLRIKIRIRTVINNFGSETRVKT